MRSGLVDEFASMVAFAGGVMNIVNAGDDRLMAEGWRTLGYLVFAAIFAFAIGAVPEAQVASVVDLGLVVTTVAAYVLCKGWLSWRVTAPAVADYR
ncbi:hypothetical protein [Herbidospora mongoliensis]|uniref:hypothetical protein n=1 Tax=Herbidospora mongoliensis TaxID=688067 RepID=UPI0009FCB03F|nr:hypothetical protein [Herbidospora mongoliensis]